MLEELWRIPLYLDSPANVVVGRLGGAAYFCVQGTRAEGIRQAAVRQDWPTPFGSARRDGTKGRPIIVTDRER